MSIGKSIFSATTKNKSYIKEEKFYGIFKQYIPHSLIKYEGDIKEWDIIEYGDYQLINHERGFQIINKDETYYLPLRYVFIKEFDNENEFEAIFKIADED